MAKTSKKVVVAAAPTKAKKETTSTRVHLVNTNYHFWRHWVKHLLADTTAKFVKNEVGYTGVITVDAPELIKVKKILDKYTKDHPDEVAMWS